MSTDEANRLAKIVTLSVDACLYGWLPVEQCGAETAEAWAEARRLGVEVEMAEILGKGITGEMDAALREIAEGTTRGTK